MTAQALALPLNLYPERGLSAYIKTVNTQPMLSAAEERKLARRYRQHNDLDAARQLVLSQLRYVVHVARGFSGYGLPLADLIQEGNLGLMKAVKHFDPARKVRLVSFAVHWIKAEMYDYVLRNWRIVKVATTKAQRKLFFNLRKSRARLGWMNQGEVNSMAKNLDVDPETVQQMEARMGHTDVPFDADDDSDDENFRAAPAGYLQDMRYNPEVLATKSDQDSTRVGRRCTTRLPSSTTARATSFSAAGWPRTSRHCTNWRASTASPPSVSVSLKPRHWNK